MKACYLGSVNRWECDENDHLNVRFFAEKANQAADVFLRATGALPAAGEHAIRLNSQHIRFLREARIATPLQIDCALVAGVRSSETLRVACYVRQTLTGEPLAAFVTDIAGCAAPADVPPGSLVQAADLPDWVGPRGIERFSGRAPPDLAAAEALGFRRMGRGVISATECREDGSLLPHVYIGRISDGMPNLWAFMSDESHARARDAGDLGGAAVEYRLEVIAPLRAGTTFSHLSGIVGIGRKTQHMAHLIYDESTAQLAARAEAIGVAMDLETRRAVAISDERRGLLERLLIGRSLP